MANNPNTGPSWWYCLPGVLAILAGCGLFLYALVHGIPHVTDNLAQIIVPGERDLTLLPRIKYTIFLEMESVVDGRIYSTQSVDGLSCLVTSKASGKAIDLHRPSMSTTYSTGGRDGRSVLEFVSQEAGVYQIGCHYDPGMQGPQVVVAVGSDVGGRIFLVVLRSLLSFLGGFIIGGSIILVVVVLRVRARRRSHISAIHLTS